MGAIADNAGITVSQVAKFAQADETTHADRLALILAGALSEADAYCQNDFDETTDYESGLKVIPPAIIIWVLQRCARVFNQPSLGVTKEYVRDVGSAQYQGTDDDYRALAPYRLNPGF
jgi:hypothetical protein